MKTTSQALQAKRKGGKGCPKLKRSSRCKAKYQRQTRRTFNNKLRRVMQSNGMTAAKAYAAKYGRVAYAA